MILIWESKCQETDSGCVIILGVQNELFLLPGKRFLSLFLPWKQCQGWSKMIQSSAKSQYCNLWFPGKKFPLYIFALDGSRADKYWVTVCLPLFFPHFPNSEAQILNNMNKKPQILNMNKKPQILNTNKNLKFWIYEYKLWTKENDICTLISILALPHIVDTSIGARAHQDHILVSGFVLSWGGNKFNW